LLCPVLQREQQQSLLRMVLTLRVLGKFIGYLDFISYQSTEPAVTSVTQLAVSARQQVWATLLFMFTTNKCQFKG